MTLKEYLKTLLQGTKTYVDEKIAEVSNGGNIDLSDYETTENAQLKLNEAKSYTNEQIDSLNIKPISELANYCGFNATSSSTSNAFTINLIKDLSCNGIIFNPCSANWMANIYGGETKLTSMVGSGNDLISFRNFIKSDGSGYIEMKVGHNKYLFNYDTSGNFTYDSSQTISYTNSHGILTQANNLSKSTSYSPSANTDLSTKKYVDDSVANINLSTYETTENAQSKLDEAKTYADSAATQVKNDLLNGAGAAYDTLKELGDLIDTNVDAIEALETAASGKADKVHTHSWNDLEDKPFGEEESDDYIPTGIEYVISINGNPTTYSDLILEKGKAYSMSYKPYGSATFIQFEYDDYQEVTEVDGKLYLGDKSNYSVENVYQYDGEKIEFWSSFLRQYSPAGIKLTELTKIKIKTIDEKFIPDTIARKGFTGELDLSNGFNIIDFGNYGDTTKNGIYKVVKEGTFSAGSDTVTVPSGSFITYRFDGDFRNAIIYTTPTTYGGFINIYYAKTMANDARAEIQEHVITTLEDLQSYQHKSSMVNTDTIYDSDFLQSNKRYPSMYVMKNYVQNNVDTLNTEIDTKLEGKANTTHTHDQYLTEHQDLSNYALKSEIPSTTGLASESYVDEKIESTEARIDELFQNVNNGKELIASAIVDKGVYASEDETFQELSNKISQIIVGPPGTNIIGYIDEENDIYLSLSELENGTYTLKLEDNNGLLTDFDDIGEVEVA